LASEASFVPTYQLFGEGDYYIEERIFPRVDFPRPSEKCALLNDLQVIWGVGPVTESKLKSEDQTIDYASRTESIHKGRAA
jgi:hypothetical protein